MLKSFAENAVTLKKLQQSFLCAQGVPFLEAAAQAVFFHQVAAILEVPAVPPVLVEGLQAVVEQAAAGDFY